MVQVRPYCVCCMKAGPVWWYLSEVIPLDPVEVQMMQTLHTLSDCPDPAQRRI
jgi:hypothetical protein